MKPGDPRENPPAPRRQATVLESVEEIRAQVRHGYARLLAHVQALSGAEPERIDEFIRYGMWLNVAAAMGVGDLSMACDWVQRELSQPTAE